MTAEHNYEDVKTVSRDGVTVERELLCTDAGIQGSFEIDSRRDGSVEVRIVDELPKYFPIDDVAFRPGETPERGTISEEQVSVTQRVAGKTVRIEYGIVPSEPVAEIRWSAPTIQRVESVAPSEAEGPQAVGAGGSVGPVSSLRGLFGEDADPTARAGDGDAGEETESTGNHATGSALEPGRGDRELQADGHGTDGSTSAEPAGEDPPAPEVSSPDGDGVSAGTDGQIADADGAPAGMVESADVARSFEVRLDRLTARVEKFGAYAAALEPLIDERGTGSEVIGGIENDLEDLDQRLDAVRSDIASVRDDRAEALADVHESIDRIDAALDGVEAEVGTLEAAVDGLEGGLDEAEQGLDVLEDRVDEHEGTIEDVETGLSDVASDVDDVERNLAEVESDVDEVERDVEDVQSDVDGVQSDVETVEREVTAVETEVGTVQDGVETVHEDVEGVESDLRALEDRVDGFESELGSLRESVAGIEDELSAVSETAQSVSAELEGIHDEVERLHEFRRSLAQISDVDG